MTIHKLFHNWTLSITGIVALTTSSILAQDTYQKFAPKNLPPNQKTAPLPSPPLQEQGDNQPITDQLVGLVFWDAPEKVSPKVLTNKGLQTGGIDLLSKPEFAALMQQYLGKPASMKTLDEIVRAVIIYYRDHDRPVVDVSVPEQDAAGGVVQLVVVEARLNKIEAQGQRWFSKSILEEGIRLKPGDHVVSSKLLDDIDWLNQNPFHSSSAVLTPGESPGETSIIVKTQDRFPLRTYVGYENTGSPLAGYDRMSAGFNWGNAFFANQLLNYQFTTSSNVDAVVAHSGSYVVQLPWRHTLTVFGAISTSHIIQPSFDVRGGGDQLGLRYEIPLPTWRSTDPASPLSYTESVYGGYDWKQSNNFLQNGIVPLLNTNTDVGEWVLGYRSLLTDPWGSLAFNPEIDCSPTRLWTLQTNTAYEQARANANPVFTVAKVEITRNTKLPFEMSLVNIFRAQLSSTNLLPGEQMVFGGEDYIRGYNDQDLSGTDNGWLIRNELRAPSFSLFQLFGKAPVSDQLTFLAFYDYGQAWSYNGQLTLNNGNAAPNINFIGVGPGLRYNIGSYLSVVADYGFQLHDTGDADGSRWHLAVTCSY